MKIMQPMSVERDDMGYWTHPDYFVPSNGNEFGVPGEFDAWLEAQGMECSILSLESDNDELAEQYADGELDGDVTTWNPSQPAGEGWFIGSIHDTEDGPYCIWFRKIGSAS